MANKAYITAKVFKWARESAKITEEIAASKVHVPIEKFKEWENGKDYPTIRQAQKLAKEYKKTICFILSSQMCQMIFNLYKISEKQVQKN